MQRNACSLVICVARVSDVRSLLCPLCCSLADDLAALGHVVTAVDNAPAAIEVCRQRSDAAAAAAAVAADGSTSAAPPAQRATFLVADATALPFEDGAFDAVIDKATLDVRCTHACARCAAPFLA
jgi:SAM-dependent methyltransferase